MTVSQTFRPLLAELMEAGIKVRLVAGGQLEVKAPGGRLPPSLRDRIAAHKPEFISWLTDGRSGRAEPGEMPPVVADPAHAGDPFPLSDLQTSFLIGSLEGFEHHVRPHQYMEFDFGELDPDRYEAALNHALRRQRPNLVVVSDDMRLVAVADPVPVRVRVTDFRGLPGEQAEAHMARVREVMQRRELPLDRWPWMDIEITRYGAGRGRLHYNNNNFFSDAPGTFAFLDSVMRIYLEPAQPLPRLPVSVRDCVLVLAGQEDSPHGQAAKAYWCDRMAGWPGPPELPLVARPDTRRRSRLQRREMLFPAELWGQVKQRAASHGVTPTNAACACHAEVLAHWSGSRHFLLNNMISHRLQLHEQAGDVLGNFAALYPLEVDWRHEETFRDRARRLQAQVIADMEHTQWSGANVLQALNQIRGTPGRAACPYAVGSAMFLGRVDRPLYSLLETPQVIFDCEFWELRDGRMWVIWDVIEEMFPPGLIDAMQDGYRAMLTHLAADSGWHSSAPDLLPAGQGEQRARLNQVPAAVIGPAATGSSARPEGLLHAALPARAARQPDRPAVISGTTTLSYAGLHNRSRRLAARLQDAGIRAGDLVAVIAPKGWPQVVAVLATLTAGGAYVPIDPGWPHDRIRYLLADTKARAVLTDQPGSCDGWAGVPVLAVLDSSGQVPDRSGYVPDPSGHVPDTVPARRCPEDLAYVIYTSGSTGQPKGAMLDHRGPLNTITDINRRFGIGSADVMFGVSSLCFDLSVYDIFGAIEAGATLVLPDRGEADPAAWLRLAVQHRVTVWNSVPALMQLLAAEAAAAGVRLPALRTVLLSGDWIPVELPARIRSIAPNARVISLGGATEASIWSICYPVGEQDPDWPSIPYGRPLAGQSWHVLDATGRDAPIWVPGQLYIGGIGLALGYLGDPDRTSACFGPHPRTGERLYRTGDLGRYLPSGDIEFLGRADFQVKIQGFRVEPGEVEHALLSHPLVAQAAVVARETPAGRQLAAFAVPTVSQPAATRPAPADLRDFLAGQLPAHLVPSTVTVLDALPLTPNGKLDRRALQSVKPAAAPVAPRPHEAPRTETEAVVVGIWAEVLGRDLIGVHDDFFELGGQSFAALRVSSLLAQRSGRRVPLGTLLERRTVASLAQWLDSPDATWSPLVWLEPPGGGNPWFFVHPAGGTVLCYRQLATLLGHPFGAFQAPAPAAGRPPLDTVAGLAGTYLPALLEARPHGPYLLGGWSSGAVIALELTHRLEQHGERVERLVVIDAPAPVAPRQVAEDELLPWFLEDLAIGLDPATLAAAAQPPALSQPERIAAALRLAPCPPAGHGQHPARLDPAVLASQFPVFRGVVRACHAYQAPTVAADITVLRAADGTVTEFEGHPSAAAPDWGWATLTTGTVTTATVPGTHHFLLTGPHVATVAGAITRLAG